MKKTFLLSSKAGIAFVIACSGIMILLASCSKSKDFGPDPVGEAKIRYINTVQGSLLQDLYVTGVKKNTDGLAYGNSSGYLSFTSGINSFRVSDVGTTTANAETGSVRVDMGANISLFYYKNPTGTLVAGLIPDDVVASNAGKAKVRFVNLNNMLNNKFAVTIDGETSVLLPSLDYATRSDYFLVAAGSKFLFTANGVPAGPALDGSIQAGKNYTIWVDGTASTLTGHVILHN